ncbi:insulinase family protein [Glycomyces sp. L485]|uniref:M16 family metallopeptidase n=1 Tax=Glycomyces sp. L485 TaxID=2909235 RepID=UPI001F4B5E35|nr:insulinase family protein [Glycomyces sp. L485]MCH7232159.1 insulinase family protein [Glycomyces sp. L485]
MPYSPAPETAHFLETTGGASAVVVARPGARVTALSIRLSVGSFDDPEGRNGTTHLVEHLLYGPNPGSQGGSFQVVEHMGGFANARTSAEHTNFYAAVPAGLSSKLFAREADRMTDTLDWLTSASLEHEKNVVLNEIRQRRGRKELLAAQEHVMSSWYGPGAPASFLSMGTPSHLQRIEPESCVAFLEHRYRRARVAVSAVGDVEPEQMSALAESLGTRFDGSSASAAERLPINPGPRCVAAHSVDGGERAVLGVPLPAYKIHSFEHLRLATLLFAGNDRSDRLRQSIVPKCVATVRAKLLPRSRTHSIGLIELVPDSGSDARHAVASFDLALRQLADAPDLEDRIERVWPTYRTEWLQGDDDPVGLANGLSHALLTGDEAAYLEWPDTPMPGAEEIRGALQTWQRGERCEILFAP